MQNRYVGDVGDFGKIGMLRCIENFGMNIGVNWYLVENENHNQDGKHIGYLQDKNYFGIDEELRMALDFLIKENNRSIEQLEKLELLKSNLYYHEIIRPIFSSVQKNREEWHKNAIKCMQDCELVFLDPDNGLIPKSVSRGSIKSRKYLLPEEIIDYYTTGHSVVFYNHRTREQIDTYLNRFSVLFESDELKRATIFGVSFKRGTLRDYFFIVRKEHEERILGGINDLLRGNWGRHFIEIRQGNMIIK